MPVECLSGVDPNCFRLTTTLLTKPVGTGPTHPFSHAFGGDTLVFYGDTEVEPDTVFAGPAYAWRPGWSATRLLANDVFRCEADVNSPAVQCQTDVDFGDNSPEATVTLKLVAGLLPDVPPDVPSASPVEAGLLSEVERTIVAISDGVGVDAEPVSRFAAQFDPSGTKLVYSTPATKEADAPIFLSVVDLATGSESTLWEAAADGRRDWLLARDGKSVFFVKDVQRTADDFPIASLYVADFPSGQNERLIRTEVFSFSSGEKSGLGVLEKPLPSGAVWSVLPDTNRPLDWVEGVAEGVIRGFLSPNATYSLVSTDVSPDIGTFDLRVVKNDGSRRVYIADRTHHGQLRGVFLA